MTCSARSRRVFGRGWNNNISVTNEQRQRRECTDETTICDVYVDGDWRVFRRGEKTRRKIPKRKFSNGGRKMGNSTGRVQRCGLWSSRRAFEHCCAPVAHSPKPKPLPSPQRIHLRAPPFYFYHHIFRRSAHYLCEPPGTAGGLGVFLFVIFCKNHSINNMHCSSFQCPHSRYFDFFQITFVYNCKS